MELPALLLPLVICLQLLLPAVLVAEFANLADGLLALLLGFFG